MVGLFLMPLFIGNSGILAGADPIEQLFVNNCRLLLRVKSQYELSLKADELKLASTPASGPLLPDDLKIVCRVASNRSLVLEIVGRSAQFRRNTEVPEQCAARALTYLLNDLRSTKQSACEFAMIPEAGSKDVKSARKFAIIGSYLPHKPGNEFLLFVSRDGKVVSKG